MYVSSPGEHQNPALHRTDLVRIRAQRLMDQWGERQAEAQRRKEEKQLARQTKLEEAAAKKHEGVLPVKVRDREGGGGGRESARAAPCRTQNEEQPSRHTHHPCSTHLRIWCIESLSLFESCTPPIPSSCSLTHPLAQATAPPRHSSVVFTVMRCSLLINSSSICIHIHISIRDSSISFTSHTANPTLP